MRAAVVLVACLLAGCATGSGGKSEQLDLVGPACNGGGAYGLVVAAGPVGLLGLGLVSHLCSKMSNQ